jgi:quinol---cytochrome c reductase iron-sulfur subunit
LSIRQRPPGENVGDAVTPPEQPPSEEQRRAERAIAVSFAVSALAGLGLFVVYLAGGQTQIEGVLLALALGGLGVGIAVWGEELLDAREVVEERHELSSGAEARQALGAALAEEAGSNLRRRSFLVTMLLAAGAAFAAALALPVISLGPAPGRSLKETSWKAGTRLVLENGQPIRPDDLVLDQVLSVLPEGHLNAADSVALLIRVPPGQIAIPAERAAATVNGVVCYSKICTHAGCPVGLYKAAEHTLFCPCHQSQFNVLQGCKPIFGPASRPLPQLPLAVDAAGYLYATGDFFEPVGPAFWDRNRT